jgi:glycosidase
LASSATVSSSAGATSTPPSSATVSSGTGPSSDTPSSAGGGSSSGGVVSSSSLAPSSSAGATDAGPPCGQVTFRYNGAATSVLVSGTFNGWAATAGAGAYAMTDPNSTGTWSVSRVLTPGRHEYKLIVDGTWILDPQNPNTVESGGYTNNYLDVESCGGGGDGGVARDAGHEPAGCGQVTFRYSGAATSVLVSGTFNGWAANLGAGAWAMAAEGNNWSVTRTLEPGSYLYKLIVDGNWILDPANPNTAEEGGVTNSLLVVADCRGSLTVVSHNGPTVSGSINAVVRMVPPESVLDPGTVVVSVNHVRVTSGVTISGNDITLSISGVSPGIHDVRVAASDGDENAAKPILLKFHRDVSTNWLDSLLYFVMTDRFRNGNPGNDAPVTDVDSRVNFQGGDLAGVTHMIEDGYFDRLGVNALWISWPVDNANGAEDGSRPNEHNCNLNPATMAKVAVKYSAYHGYWPEHLDQLEARFGTLAELQDLVDTAHAAGIRVLLDFTANHVYASSPLFQQHPEYFNWPTSGSSHICENVGWDNEPETCWFTSYLPDLDYRNNSASNTVVDHALKLVHDTGADGFRFDAVKHLNRNFIRVLRSRLRAEVELTGIDFVLIGETFTGDTNLINSFIGSDLVHGQFDFPLNMQVLKGLATTEVGLDAMDNAARGIKAVYGNAVMSNFLGNHDISRFISLASGDVNCGVWNVVSDIAQGWLYPPPQPGSDQPYNRLRLAFAYIMTVPGIPLIYYGDEYGMPGAGDPDNRRFMRFNDPAPASPQLNDREAAMLEWTQRLGSLRAAHPALRTGAWSNTLWSESTLLAYARTSATEKVIVVINRGDARSVELTVSGIGVADGARFLDALATGATPVTVGSGKLAVSVAGQSAAVLVPSN